MNSYLIDTNCLISFVINRNKNQYEMMEEIFKRASSLELEVFIISNVITEFVYVLQTIYKTKPAFISKMLLDLLKNPGVEFHHGYFPDKILKLWPEKIVDFGDAVIAAAAKELDISVITFDTDFSKQLKKIKVPNSLLK